MEGLHCSCKKMLNCTVTVALREYVCPCIFTFDFLLILCSGMDSNFEKYGASEVDTLEAAYDYNSVMHYGLLSFSKNGQNTIQAIHNATRELGNREGLSTLDAIQINKLYDCEGRLSLLYYFLPSINRYFSRLNRL